jgi:hypothetical protein
MQDEEDEEGSQGRTEEQTGAGEESDGAAALLTQLQSLVSKGENGAAGRKPAPTTARPAAAPALPLPIPVVPGAAPQAWTRERIVERHDLRAELAAEQAHGTKAVVVNFEDTHFRFRAFHSVSAHLLVSCWFGDARSVCMRLLWSTWRRRTSASAPSIL